MDNLVMELTMRYSWVKIVSNFYTFIPNFGRCLICLVIEFLHELLH